MANYEPKFDKMAGSISSTKNIEFFDMVLVKILAS